MKNSLTTTVLTWVMAAGLILSMVFAVRLFFQTRELRLYQAEMSRYQSTHQVLNTLLNDIVEYSRRDSGVLPILESIGVRPLKPAPAASTNKPSAK